MWKLCNVWGEVVSRSINMCCLTRSTLRLCCIIRRQTKTQCSLYEALETKCDKLVEGLTGHQAPQGTGIKVSRLNIMWQDCGWYFELNPDISIWAKLANLLTCCLYTGTSPILTAQHLALKYKRLEKLMSSIIYPNLWNERRLWD